MRPHGNEPQPDRQPAPDRGLSGDRASRRRALPCRLDAIACLIVLALIVCGAVWWMAVMEMAARERSEIAAVKRETANLATSFEEHMVRTLDLVEQMARMVTAEYAAKGLTLDLDRLVATMRVPPALILDIVIADQDGDIVLATRGLPRANLGDRSYFRAHRSEASDKIDIAPSVLSPLSGHWVMPASRRIDNPDGSFGGMIVLGLNPFYFSDFYQRIDLGKQGVMTLAGHDGYVRARLNAAGTGLGANVGKTAALSAIRRERNGSAVFASAIDHQTRIYSYRTLEDYPIFVLVGRSKDEALAVLRGERAASYARATAATVLVALATMCLTVTLLRQRRAERSLRAAESQCRAMFEQNAVGMVLMAPDGRMLAANAAFCAFVGYAQNELRDMDVAAYGSAEACALTRGRMRAALRGDIQSFEIEREYLHKDGRPVWGLLCATLIRDAASAPVHFVGQVLDIDARKLAEVALRESEERLRVFAENMEEIFWLATPSLDRFVYVSPALERVLGRSPAELQRNNQAWREWIPPGWTQAVDAFLQRQMRGERAELELQVARPDGELRWLLVRSVPWLRPDGAALVAGVAQDVTGRKRAEEERLSLAERQRNTLIMEVHHRIKNNLQGVLGLLSEHMRRWPESRGVLEVVATRVQSVATVHGLLGHRAGAVVLLTDLVASIAETLRRVTDAIIILQPPDASASAAQITERETVPLALVLNELIWNAYKHSSDRPKQARVSIDMDEAQGIVCVQVRNAVEESGDAGFPAGRTAGLGLGLVQALLPPRGARLTFAREAGEVGARLALSAPVLTWAPRPASAEGARALAARSDALSPPTAGDPSDV
jgi:PAS domain S-box-containing protein